MDWKMAVTSFDVHAVKKDAIVGLDVCVSVKVGFDFLNTLIAK